MSQVRASKYHNKRTESNGIWFDSQKEASRYTQLMLMQRAGLISNLELQPRYDLVVNNHKLGFYRADFRYEVTATGECITEDVKGVRTAVYQLKKKLVLALHGIEIIEV